MSPSQEDWRTHRRKWLDLNKEVAIFIKKWPDIIKNGDPYYNPNLTLRKSNFALRDLLKEKIGEPYDLSVYDKFAPEEKKSDE